jgi:chorismate mutase
MYSGRGHSWGGITIKKKNLILVDSSVLPDVFLGVLQAKKMLNTGNCTTVNEASAKAGISRSAFYKYKDYVFTVNEMQGGILTLFLKLKDVAGLLSEILNVLARVKCNILTINQNIPVNGLADITISLRTDNMNCEIEKLLELISECSGVISVEILAKQ